MCGEEYTIQNTEDTDPSGRDSFCRRQIFGGHCRWPGVQAAVQRCFTRGGNNANDVRNWKGEMVMRTNKKPSPCLTCTRVADPRNCENKNCQLWRKWFLGRWEQIHNYPRVKMEQAKMQPVGVNVGGTHYAAPHQVTGYLETDPCEKCLCPKDLCTSACRVRRAWEEARQEVFL